MPRVDPEARREYRRQYYLANRERIKADRKARYDADPEKARAAARAWYQANRERAGEKAKQWQSANPGKVDAALRRHRQTPKFRETRKRYQRGPVHRKNQRVWVHGPDVEAHFAAMWDAQDGCCYLCRAELTRDLARIDHDHTCCPRGRSCSACRRGLACDRCNTLIGQVGDDPALLRLIAGNLERVLVPTRERITAKAAAEALF
jgi:Recombination endonuclease VII